MAILPPQIHTYHCICTSLLLASTHTLSSLPRRAAPSLDDAYILPLPNEPPSFAPASPVLDVAMGEDEDGDKGMEVSSKQEEGRDMPVEGYTLLLGMQKDFKGVVVRREDGFEKRFVYRCSRCALVVGYEIASSEQSEGKEKGEEGYEGKVVYVLPNGVLTTNAMAKGTKILEGEVEIIEGKGVGVWE